MFFVLFFFSRAVPGPPLTVVKNNLAKFRCRIKKKQRAKVISPDVSQFLQYSFLVILAGGFFPQPGWYS